jgi:uncharacterized protein
MDETTAKKISESLVEWIQLRQSVVVAFSGGVDSAVVASAAFRALGDRAVAWTSNGAAVSETDRQAARRVAQSIGIAHIEVETGEIDNPNYVRNDSQRCYHCKSTLYASLRHWADQNSMDTLLSGTNADDLGDYRPGLKAAREWDVLAPLAELSVTKAMVRRIARHWQIEVADKPASPCLASRIAYGQLVTIGRLKGIEAVEARLAELGFGDVRVRLHAEGLVRIELQLSQLLMAVNEPTRSLIEDSCLRQGFQFVTLDLMGRQSGSLNRSLDESTLRPQKPL